MVYKDFGSFYKVFYVSYFMVNLEYLTRAGLTTLAGVACGTGLVYGLFEIAPRIIESAEVTNEIARLGIKGLSGYYGTGLGSGVSILIMIACNEVCERIRNSDKIVR